MELTNLSWIIYFSSMNLEPLVITLCFFIATSSLLCGVFFEGDNVGKEIVNKIIKLNCAPFILLLLCVIIMVVKPSKETIMTIAAIEYGEDTKVLDRVKILMDKYFPDE